MTKPPKLPIPADHLFSVGKSMLYGAGVVHNHIATKPDHEWMYGQFYFQMGFAIELLNKFYLATHGADDQKIISYGHDLLKAYSDVRINNFDFMHQDALQDVIDKLQSGHRGLLWRYMPDAVIEAPTPPDFVYRIVDAYLEYLEQFLQRVYTKPTGGIFQHK